MSVNNVPIWECEDCGGPAKWTLVGSQTYVHCEAQCDGFRSGERSFSSWVRIHVREDELAEVAEPNPKIILDEGEVHNDCTTESELSG